MAIQRPLKWTWSNSETLGVYVGLPWELAICFDLTIETNHYGAYQQSMRIVK